MMRLLADWRGTRGARANHLGLALTRYRRAAACRRRRAGPGGPARSAMGGDRDQRMGAVLGTVFERDPLSWQNLQGLLVAQAAQAAEGTANPVLSDPPVLEKSAALARFARLSLNESRPMLRELIDAATARHLPYVVDDSDLTLGAGRRRTDFFPLETPSGHRAGALARLHDIPTAVVTGSNGKTTTVRLLAACGRAQGWRVAYNCTDGVFLDGEPLASGDLLRFPPEHAWCCGRRGRRRRF